MCLFWASLKNSNPLIKTENDQTIVTYPILFDEKALDPILFDKTKEIKITKLY